MQLTSKKRWAKGSPLLSNTNSLLFLPYLRITKGKPNKQMRDHGKTVQNKGKKLSCWGLGRTETAYHWKRLTVWSWRKVQKIVWNFQLKSRKHSLYETGSKSNKEKNRLRKKDSRIRWRNRSDEKEL